MNTGSEIPSTKNPEDVRKGILIRFAQVAIVFLVQAVILFVTANHLDWVWAWIFLGICIVSVSVNASFMFRTNPETIAERGRAKETRSWDKLVGGLWAAALFLAVPLVSGLDARLGWTGELNPAYNIAGAVVLALGLGLGGWAMITNAYFSTAVRIQSDRGQTVCRSGPYRIVRHPGYVGFTLQSLGTPILLGSLWALIPGVTGAVLMIIRTSLEDRMLQAELSGYPEYVQEVRYRLIPGVW
jgi:protein-S-isoprenylcysteine O-methyltransferase Ste14